MTGAMNEGLSVIMISAYYKNDRPGGLGISLQFDDSNGVNFCRGLEECLPAYDRLSKEQVISGLARIARERPESRAAAMEVIAGVHWLQVRDHLVSDEFNGTVFSCIFQGTLVNSEKNPVAIDLVAEMRSKSAVDVTDIVKASKAPGIDAGLTASLRVVLDHARKKESTDGSR